MSETFGDLILALSASPVLSLLTKATLGIALGLILLRAARRARASVRHAIAASIFAALLVLPLAVWLLPSMPIVVSASPAARPVPAVSAPEPAGATAPAQSAATPVASAATSSAPSQVSWAALVVWAWALGAAIAATPLLLSLRRLGQIQRRGLPWTDGARVARELAADRRTVEMGTGPFARSDIDVLLDETLAAPVTCGVASPAIILPAEAPAWDEPALRRALRHELEHVRRGDWGVQVAARAVCALYWFHPLVWKAFRTLGLEAERTCDDAVLAHEESTQYAEQLVTLARRMSHDAALPALAMARRSDLSARVSAILDAGQPRGRAGLLRSAAVVLVAAIVVAGLAPLRVTGAVVAPDDTVADQSRRQGSARGRALDRALVESAQEGDVDGVRELLDAGGNVNAAVDGDGSPLIVAAREGDLRMVTLLLDRGADPNLAVAGDGNPLIMAAREGHLRIVTLLLDRGAQIDAVVPSDENALIQASGEGRLDVVRLLLSRGADVNARVWAEGGAYERPNGEWRTPLNMARRGGHRAVVEVLQAAGAVE